MYYSQAAFSRFICAWHTHTRSCTAFLFHYRAKWIGIAMVGDRNHKIYGAQMGEFCLSLFDVLYGAALLFIQHFLMAFIKLLFNRIVWPSLMAIFLFFLLTGKFDMITSASVIGTCWSFFVRFVCRISISIDWCAFFAGKLQATYTKQKKSD